MTSLKKRLPSVAMVTSTQAAKSGVQPVRISGASLICIHIYPLEKSFEVP